MIAKLKRREFITLLGGAAVAWPLAARAQSADRMRRIGVLMSTTADDPEGQARIAAFQQGLQQFGWAIGHNVRIDSRWASGRPRTFPQICGGTGRALARCHPGHRQRRGGTAATGDPHCTNRVCNCPRPGWSRLCQQSGAAGRQRHRIYPVRIRHQWEMAGTAQADRAWRNAGGHPSGPRHISRDRPVRCHPSRGAVARSGGKPRQCARPGRDRTRRCGLRALSEWRPDLTGSALAVVHRHLIITLAAQHQLPAIYFRRTFVADGGLISYGLICSTNTGALPVTLTAFSRARSPPICRCRRRPSTKW